MRSSLIVVVVMCGCVDPEADELGEGTSALQVCGTSLQAAIDAAPDGEVLEICAGTYRERLVVDGKRLELRGVSGAGVTIVDADAAGRALIVQGGSTVTIRGLTLRDGSTSSSGGGIACRSSTLIMRDSVVSASRAAGGGGLGAESCVLDIERTRFENNRGGSERGGGALLVSSSGRVAASAFVGNDADEGGGVATEGGTVELADNEVRGNGAHRGAGLFLGHDGRVRGNDIVDNDARWTGGGIYVDARAPTIEGNLIDGNTSVNDGGGFYVHEGPAVIRDNVITDNYSADDGGGVRLYTCRARLENNVIERNEAEDSGGGVRVSHLPALIVDNLIRDNVANRGGGLDLDNDASVLRGGVIARNRASVGGGVAAGLYPYDGGTIEDVQFLENVATSSGGALYIADNYRAVTMRHLVVRGNRAPRGAGLYIRGTTHTLANSVFAGNAATGDGGAIHVGSGTGNLDFLVLHGNSASTGSAVYSATSGLSIESSILSQNSGTAVRVSSTPTYRYNDTWPRSFSGMSDPTGSNGNISADPRFVDPGGGDFVLGSGSPAIDAGDPALRDVDGTRADMGMFGGPDGEATTPPPPPPPPPPPDDEVTAVLEADAHVRADLPDTNFGATSTLEADGSPLSEVYLRFRVTGASTVTRARLQLTVTNGTGDAPTLYSAASTWGESTITWNTRPARGGAVANLGAVSAGTVIEYDVTSLVTGDGVYTMALVPTSTDGMDVYSGEGTAPPRLILTTDGGAGATAVLEADTYAAAAAPDTSFGSASMISSDASPLEEAYVRFRVTGASTVTRARLRLLVTDASSDGPAVYLAASTWSESTLTWNNRPARSGSAIADLGAASIGQVVEYDVTDAITADGAYTFALIPTSSSGFGASSREGGTPPQLILEP